MTTMLTARDIAKILGISYEAALAFIKYSDIPYIKVGRSYRVAEEKLTTFLSQDGQIIVDLHEDIA